MRISNNSIFTSYKGNYIRLGNIILLDDISGKNSKVVYFNKYKFIKYYKLSGFISDEIKNIYNNI
jgi:hypothetical protein